MAKHLKFSALIATVILATLTSASIRLPPTSHPLHYDLQLTINVDEAKFYGNVTIKLLVTSDNVSLIALNCHEVQVSDGLIYLASDNTQTNLLNRINPRPSSQIIEILTDSPLDQNTEYVLRLTFEGAIRSDLKGLYMSSYWTNGTKRNIATTFFAPHYARMAFPCYDEPQYKATFDVRITNHVKYHALGNSAPSSIVQTGDSITTTFQRTPKMSTYLLAFIVSDLVANRDTQSPSTAVWATESNRLDTAFSLGYVQQVRHALEDYLGLPYQISKLDLVAIDDFLMGAMENWGLITFGSNNLLAREGEVTTAERQSILKIVAHEVAHQWFGNLVTCQWWNDIWLNEGFATYLEDVIVDKVANQWLVLDQFVVAEKIPGMRKDSDRANRKAMADDVTTLDEITNIYDFVAYPKAGSVLRMFHHVVGERVFQRTLQEYLKMHQYQNVVRKDFFSVLEKVAKELNFVNAQGVSLSEAFEHWSVNYGLPLVTVERNYDRELLNITQARFIHSNFNPQTPALDFFVPLKFATETQPGIDSSLGLHWLTPKAPAINMPFSGQSWILLNPNAFGYYRVNYDEQNWRKLISALQATNNIPPSSRVQLIDDIMTLARFGHVRYSTALDLIRYVKTETNYTPVTVALGQLEELTRSLRGSQVNISGLNYDIIDSLYATTKGTTHVDKLLEAKVKSFACRQAYDKCIRESHAMLDAYVEKKEIDPDLRKTMFCGSMQSSNTGEEEERFPQVFSIWMRLAKSEYERATNERHVVDILDAFACLRNETTLQELLTFSLRNDVGIFMTASDRVKIFTSVVSGSLEGTGLALDMLRNNWNVAIERYGAVSSIYAALGPNVMAPAHVTIFNEIVFAHMRKSNLQTLEPRNYEAAMAAVRQVEENVQFVANHRDQLRDWFEENYPGSAAAFLSSRISILLVGVTVACLFLRF